MHDQKTNAHKLKLVTEISTLPSEINKNFTVECVYIILFVVVGSLHGDL